VLKRAPSKILDFRRKSRKSPKNQQKTAFSAEIPKKTVEIPSFSIDFARPEAALLRTAGFFAAA
jgi:hypothetical protein